MEFVPVVEPMILLLMEAGPPVTEIPQSTPSWVAAPLEVYKSNSADRISTDNRSRTTNSKSSGDCFVPHGSCCSWNRIATRKTLLSLHYYLLLLVNPVPNASLKPITLLLIRYPAPDCIKMPYVFGDTRRAVVWKILLPDIVHSSLICQFNTAYQLIWKWLSVTTLLLEINVAVPEP